MLFSLCFFFLFLSFFFFLSHKVQCVKGFISAVSGPNELKFSLKVDKAHTSRCFFFHFFDKVLRNDFIGIFGWKSAKKHIFCSCTLILRPNDLKFGTLITWWHALRCMTSRFGCGPFKSRNGPFPKPRPPFDQVRFRTPPSKTSETPSKWRRLTDRGLCA